MAARAKQQQQDYYDEAVRGPVTIAGDDPYAAPDVPEQQTAQLNDTVGVAGTTMTEADAAELVNAGNADVEAEHPEPGPPYPQPEDLPPGSPGYNDPADLTRTPEEVEAGLPHDRRNDPKPRPDDDDDDEEPDEDEAASRVSRSRTVTRSRSRARK